MKEHVICPWCDERMQSVKRLLKNIGSKPLWRIYYKCTHCKATGPSLEITSKSLHPIQMDTLKIITLNLKVENAQSTQETTKQKEKTRHRKS